MVTDAAGCFSILPVIVGFTNGIEDINSYFAVYPNPAKTELFVELSNIDATGIELVNVLGQTMSIVDVNSDITRIDVSKYEAGVYFIHVYGVNKDHVSRIVIK
jgi:glucuronoarabinoxylan endo-1,4-beta-xylanase